MSIKALEATGEEVGLFYADGKWCCMIGNSCASVYIGEATPKVQSGWHKSQAKAIKEALLAWEAYAAYMADMTDRIVKTMDQHRETLEPILERANDELKALGPLPPLEGPFYLLKGSDA